MGHTLWARPLPLSAEGLGLARLTLFECRNRRCRRAFLVSGSRSRSRCVVLARRTLAGAVSVIGAALSLDPEKCRAPTCRAFSFLPPLCALRFVATGRVPHGYEIAAGACVPSTCSTKEPSFGSGQGRSCDNEGREKHLFPLRN